MAAGVSLIHNSWQRTLLTPAESGNIGKSAVDAFVIVRYVWSSSRGALHACSIFWWVHDIGAIAWLARDATLRERRSSAQATVVLWLICAGFFRLLASTTRVALTVLSVDNIWQLAILTVSVLTEACASAVGTLKRCAVETLAIGTRLTLSLFLVDHVWRCTLLTSTTRTGEGSLWAILARSLLLIRVLARPTRSACLVLSINDVGSITKFAATISRKLFVDARFTPQLVRRRTPARRTGRARRVRFIHNVRVWTSLTDAVDGVVCLAGKTIDTLCVVWIWPLACWARRASRIGGIHNIRFGAWQALNAKGREVPRLARLAISLIGLWLLARFARLTHLVIAPNNIWCFAVHAVAVCTVLGARTRDTLSVSVVGPMPRWTGSTCNAVFAEGAGWAVFAVDTVIGVPVKTMISKNRVIQKKGPQISKKGQALLDGKPTLTCSRSPPRTGAPRIHQPSEATTS